MPTKPDQPVAPPPLVNLANALTVLRLVLVPVFVIVFVQDSAASTGWRVAAAGVFAFAALTDLYDGHLARTRGIVTDFGKLADPIADKALIAAALICLSVYGLLSWWVTGIILAREVAVTVIRMAVVKYQVIAASWGGKVKTATQVAAIFGFLLPSTWINDHGNGLIAMFVTLLMVVAVAATVATGFDYALTAGGIVRRAKAQAARPESESGSESDSEAGDSAEAIAGPVAVSVAAAPAGVQSEALPDADRPTPAPSTVSPPAAAPAAQSEPPPPAAAGAAAVGSGGQAEPARKRPRVRFKPVPGSVPSGQEASASRSAQSDSVSAAPKAPTPGGPSTGIGATAAGPTAAPSRAAAPAGADRSQDGAPPGARRWAPPPRPSFVIDRSAQIGSDASAKAQPAGAEPASQHQPAPASETVKPTRPVEGWPDADSAPVRPSARPPTAAPAVRAPEWEQLRTVRRTAAPPAETAPTPATGPTPVGSAPPAAPPAGASAAGTAGVAGQPAEPPTARTYARPASAGRPATGSRPVPAPGASGLTGERTASAEGREPTAPRARPVGSSAPERAGLGDGPTASAAGSMDAAQAAAEARLAELKRRIGWNTSPRPGSGGEE
ncbi:MAG: CDP-diacylglycerol--glycerol-3-phosphate 3-phosphatidyltransferase [Bifidobacteriaceae bacterium]|nr:CDP-diacylglycerol--glycerol-3-phosphate 3-phosphatidyltransferase [Bifidobacteriaceae bacterium]